MTSSKHIQEITVNSASELNSELFSDFQPKVIRGLTHGWPLVQQALKSNTAVTDYLQQFYNGQSLKCWVAEATEKGRFFYNSKLNGLNFNVIPTQLDRVLTLLQSQEWQESGKALYLGSTSTTQCLPGLTQDNNIPLIPDTVIPNIWVGSASRVAPHFDLSDNVACVCAGERVFTLFPPDQISNLYFGPLDHTPAGQPISMVNLDSVDYAQFPKFSEAEKTAITIELHPGDAIYIPSMWIHSVKALSDFNVLINYWWENTIKETGSPYDAMLHGILTLSQLSPERRQAWKALYDHYVFQTNGDPAEHLPENVRGPLAKMTPKLALYIKNFLLSSMSKLKP